MTITQPSPTASQDPQTFLDLDDVLAIHEAQVERFGGASGVRDAGLLELTFGRPGRTDSSFEARSTHLRDVRVTSLGRWAFATLAGMPSTTGSAAAGSSLAVPVTLGAQTLIGASAGANTASCS